MGLQREKLEPALEQALQLLARQRGTAAATAIKPILFASLERGRIERYLGESPDCSPYDYVRRVADCYQRWHEYVVEIQVEMRSEVWRPLYVKLQKWAYGYLRRKQFPPKGDRFQHARDCATEASMKLINARFPYDVDFDPWACVLLHNVCRKHIRKTFNPVSIPNQELVPLDKWDGWLENLLDPSGEEGHYHSELRHDLLDAIKQLSSEARQQFILLYYFEHKSFKQIAAKMDRSVNALYKLHFDALENLRKILGEKWDKYG